MRTLLLSLIFFIPVMCVAQSDSLKVNTLLDSFNVRSGNLSKREFFLMGTIDESEIEVVKITDIANNLSVIGFHFEMEYRNYLGSFKNAVANLDDNEVDGFLIALKYLQQDVISKVPDHYSEYTFTSKSNFKLVAYWTTKQKHWTIYLQLKEFDNDTQINLSAKDLNELIPIIERCKNKMESLKDK